MNPFVTAPPPLRVAGIVAAAAVVLAAFAALTGVVALAGLRRLSPDLDPSNAPAWLWYYRGDPEVRRWLSVGAAAAAVALAVVALGVARSLAPPLHGAARWANETDLQRAGLRARSGIVVGRKGGAPLVFGGSEHVLLQAPTRAGKGVGVVIPNLLTWPGSVVVLDIKRENWEATAGFRAAHGQRVFLFDPLDPQGRTARFNPLGHVDRDDRDQVLDELQKLAVMLFPAPPNADPFWSEAARTGFVGVGALVADTPELPFSLGAIFAELTRDDPRSRLSRIAADRTAVGRPLSTGCRTALGDFCAASENTFASIRQTITSRMNLWLSPRVCAATEASDFDMRTLRTDAQSIYLAASPDNLARVAPLYALLFQQLIDLNTRERPGNGRLNLQVLVLLDEFARLGHASVLAHAFAYVAGYGLRLLPVLQSTAQLRAEYGPDLAEEIVANCALELVFAPKELRVANDTSERLGFTTVRSASRSRPAGLARGHRTLSESDQRRALLLPQEIMQLPQTDLLVLKAGMPPARARKLVYFRDRAFLARLRPAPGVSPRPVASDTASVDADDGPAPSAAPRTDLLTLEGVIAALAAERREPPPPEGASPAAVEEWVERFIDGSARMPEEVTRGA